MALFTTSQTGNINDGGTFGNTSPGVAGTDYPDPAGGDEIAFGGAHTLTIPSGYSTTIKGDATGTPAGSIGSSGAALVVTGTLTQDGNLYLQPGTSYTLSTGGTHNLGGHNFGPDNDSSEVTDTYTFGGTAASPATVNLGGGTWDSVTPNAAGKQYRTSISIGYLIVDYGAANNTGRFKPNHFVQSANGWIFSNGVLELRRVYDLQLNAVFFGTSDISLGTIIISSFSTAASPPNASILTRSGAPAGGESQTGDAIVIDGRTGNRPGLIEFDFTGTLTSYISIKGGNLRNGLNLPYTITNEFIYDDRDIPFGDTAKKLYASGGRKVWLGDASQINHHVFDLAENKTVEFTDWLIDIPGSTGDGPDIGSLNSWSTGSLTASGNVLLTNQEGALVNALGVSAVADMPATVERNTVVTRVAGVGFYGGLAKTEAGGAPAAKWGNLTVRSNLTAALPAVTGDLAGISFQDAATNQVTSTNYNAFWNITDHYLNVVFDPAKTEGADADFGLNDVTLSADPFVDSTRTVTSWITGELGLASVTAYLDELAKFNGAGWNSAYDPFAVDTGGYDWVRAGYVVTDAALNGTAHDGGVIGAMGYQAQSAGGSGSVGLAAGMIGGIGKLGTL